MRDDPLLINLLACPACGGDLNLPGATAVAPDGHVMQGELRCAKCDTGYPILHGVPRFVPSQLESKVSNVAKGFGYEWQQFDSSIQGTRFASVDIFMDFIHPVQSDFFEGKIVLDAGCGGGRFTLLSQQLGAKTVVGLDLSESVNAAFENTRHFPNVLIIQADLFSPPLKQRFDFVFSVGVLHHTPDPRHAFDSLVALTKPGGGVSAWVYGLENNERLVRFLNPLRLRVTSRLPHGILFAISHIITVPLFLISKGIYRPVGRLRQLQWLRKYLFYFDYLFFLSQFSFRQQSLTTFDHLVPSITEYIPGDDFARWFQENGLRDVVITSRTRNSWRGFGIRPA